MIKISALLSEAPLQLQIVCFKFKAIGVDISFIALKLTSFNFSDNSKYWNKLTQEDYIK